MSEEARKLKDIIKYLNRVNNSDEIEPMPQNFFLKKEELRDLIKNYYIEFKNDNDLSAEVRYNYKILEKLNFERDVFYRIKDLTNNGRVKYSKKQHQAYAYEVRGFLVDEFKEKLGIKSEKVMRTLTVKNKEVYDLFKALDSELDIFETGDDFINASVLNKGLDFYLNITNRDFHHLITALKPYFFNFTYGKFIVANNIYTKTSGKKIKIKNFQNSKSVGSENTDSIDKIINKFKNS